MKALLPIILVIALVGASSYEEEYLQSLKQTDFGKTILQSIQLELGQGTQTEGVNRIVAMLRQMRADLQSDQSQANLGLRDKSKYNNEQLRDVESRLTASRQQKADDERRLPMLSEEQRHKELYVAEKMTQEQRNLDRIHQLTEVRDASRREYESRRDELTGLAATLTEAKRIIAQLKTGSFLQVSEPILAELQRHTQKFQKHYQSQRGFHGLVSLLLETVQNPGVQANQSGVQKVISVIEQLVESIYDLQKQELKAENERQQDYLTQRARLELENTRLEGTIAHLRAQIQVITQTMLELNNDIATNVQIIQNKEKEQADWQKTQADTQRFHELATANRNEQIGILNQVITIFETSFEGVTAFIQNLKIN